MGRKRHSPEHIINKLREADVLLTGVEPGSAFGLAFGREPGFTPAAGEGLPDDPGLASGGGVGRGQEPAPPPGDALTGRGLAEPRGVVLPAFGEAPARPPCGREDRSCHARGSGRGEHTPDAHEDRAGSV
jgi:hypothetical protein